jgi:hypothetical protein
VLTDGFFLWGAGPNLLLLFPVIGTPIVVMWATARELTRLIAVRSAMASGHAITAHITLGGLRRYSELEPRGTAGVTLDDDDGPLELELGIESTNVALVGGELGDVWPGRGRVVAAGAKVIQGRRRELVADPRATFAVVVVPPWRSLSLDLWIRTYRLMFAILCATAGAAVWLASSIMRGGA